MFFCWNAISATRRAGNFTIPTELGYCNCMAQKPVANALTLELEAYLTDRIALLVNTKERMLFGSDIGKFHTQVSLGLKFIIN